MTIKQKKKGVGASSYHLKEHCGSDSHPVQLDLEGSVEGEVSVIITAAPFGSVTAVVNVHVQSDRLLLRDCSSCRTEGGRWRDRRTRGKGSKRKGDGWRDGQADGGVRAEVVRLNGVRLNVCNRLDALETQS